MSRAVAVATVCAVVLLGCGGAQRDEEPAHVMMSERLIACDTLVTELRLTDTRRATEQELMERMQAAQQSAEVCARLWREAADTYGERVIADQEARQLPFHALLLESALSARFDDYEHYCAILDDTMAILFAGLAEIEEALAGDALDEEERAKLVELGDLDLEAIDVLLLHRAENCE